MFDIIFFFFFFPQDFSDFSEFFFFFYQSSPANLAQLNFKNRITSPNHAASRPTLIMYNSVWNFRKIRLGIILFKTICLCKCLYNEAQNVFGKYRLLKNHDFWDDFFFLSSKYFWPNSILNFEFRHQKWFFWELPVARSNV